MKKLVSIVDNSVTRDTRVQKEAVSVANDLGCDYHIFGVVDKHDNKPESFLSDRVKVTRLPVKPLKKSIGIFLKNMPRSFVGFLTLFCFTLGCALLVWCWPLTAFVVGMFVAILGILRFFKLLKISKFLFFLPPAVSSDLRTIFLNYTRSLQLAYEFEPVLRKVMPDILHAHDVPMLIVASHYKQFNPNVKIIFDSHELYEHMSEKGPLYQKFYQNYIRKLAKDVDVFITINESISDYYNKSVPALPKGIIVKNAISGSVLKIDKKSHLLQEKTGVPAGKKILLYQGMFSAPRGLDRIIKAAPLLNPEWAVVFMGWGTNEIELKEEAARAGFLGSRIFFIPPAKMSELNEWTSGADIGIIPYLNNCLNHYYCTPNKLWEYPIAGLPIIVPDYPELARVINQFDIGWKIPDMEPESIAAIINTITDDQIEAKKQNIESYFISEGWDVYKKSLVSAYTNLLSNLQ